MYIPEIELSVKIKGKPNQLKRALKTSKEAHAAALEIFNADTINWVEEVLIICLNTANEIIGYYKVSRGGVSASVVDVKVIATIALQCAASQVLLMHNHPSGNTKPSEADRNITLKIRDGLRLLDIKLIDHMIITPEKYYSFVDEGEI